MKFLAVNTAAAVEAALYNGKFFRDEQGKRASALLMPQIDSLLCGSGLDLSDLDYIACVVGPGSFTGIRIGVSAVRSMCYARNLPALPIHYMQMLAYNDNADGGNILTVSDGSNGTAYVCEFDRNRKFAGKCECIACADAIAKANAYDGFVCADGFMSSLIPKAIPPDDNCAALIRAAENLSGNAVSYQNLIPEYVRESQAEHDLRIKNNG